MGSGASQPTARPRAVVLVVDDDEALRESVQGHLEDHFDVRLAPDGPTALKLVSSEPIDVVLLEILMCGTDGFEIMTRLHTARPDLHIIVLTALDRAATATQAMKLGALDYVVKPSSREELVSLVSAALLMPRVRRRPS